MAVRETCSPLPGLLIMALLVRPLKGPSVAPARLLVTRIGPCDKATDTLITVSEMKLKRALFDSSMSGLVNITKDVGDGWTVKATMQKCHDVRNLDTCDFHKHSAVIERGCQDSDQEELYSMFFHYVTPELSCPLKAGNYKIVEYPFFTEDSDLVAVESKISNSLFGYTYRLEGFKDEDRILCVDAFVKHQFVRNHEWVGVATNNSEPNTKVVAKDEEETNKI